MTTFFFFGDSLTDTGNVAAANGGTLGPGYPGTSVSDGITYAKYLDPDVQLGSVLAATLTPTTGSVDFSFAGATTGDGLLPPNVIAQSQSFGIAAPLLEIDSNDLGFVWAGGNDFLAADLTQPADQLQASLLGIAGQGSTNIATAVDNILGAGVENVAVIKLINIGLAPRLNQLPGAGENFGRIASVFNGQLESKLQGANQNANIMMIDADRFLSDAVANPGAYGFTNSTEAAAPNASVGMASSLTEAELAERLFYDDIHPTTAAHQHFSNYVASHLTLGEDAGSLNLLTDAALALDDRFGFETADLEEGEIRFNAGIYQYENKSGSVGRQTQGLRADLDLGINDHMAVGAEFIYASGDAGDSTLDSFGFAMDSTLGGHLGNGLAWELGGGIGAVTGDLDREHNLGTLDASGKQLAFLLSIHAALRSDEFTFGGFGGYWELGLKERIAFRRDAAESGAASLNLRYDHETITTTLANIEMGLNLTAKTQLQLALNPVLFHSGGEISGSQANGFGAFVTDDGTGYDVHTGRLGLRHLLNEHTTINTDFIVGDDSTWGASLGFSIEL